MNTEPPLINRVAASGLITLKLEEFFPAATISEFDIKDYLFKGLLLREKDFRTALKEHDWAQYEDQILLVYCSTDAIIPMWAYMLVAAYAQPHALDVYQGSPEDFYRHHYDQVIAELDVSEYKDQRVIIKGCSDQPVPAGAYLALTKRLRPVAKSIMFGEPCSTVPIYKQPRRKD